MHGDPMGSVLSLSLSLFPCSSGGEGVRQRCVFKMQKFKRAPPPTQSSKSFKVLFLERIREGGRGEERPVCLPSPQPPAHVSHHPVCSSVSSSQFFSSEDGRQKRDSSLHPPNPRACSPSSPNNKAKVPACKNVKFYKVREKSYRPHGQVRGWGWAGGGGGGIMPDSACLPKMKEACLRDCLGRGRCAGRHGAGGRMVVVWEGKQKE